MVLAWEGEDHFVFFDASSGDTHLLSVFALLLAEVMEGDGLTQTEIRQRLLDQADPELLSGADVSQVLEMHMPRLAEVGFLLEQAV
ncbi:HPr-rel-A system PqqD family peptide chaperone [Paucibacter sp. Y2R2-4]|uniref:HPr-rel-A system PqqD family peptide chaperone n=1 Tax=Paucibacter sp. Y2R2-4 TaxID=2893553 RepID=UPI0021E49EA8|nr:HPr-rel-A system PqqD family peptide chaperone [Paucibacter sp. Y2R2-4]MCV2350775.1 HPr-rel-A system PqqD family peptide chaperone [Paucibacter sp. Y2R2-4]